MTFWLIGVGVGAVAALLTLRARGALTLGVWPAGILAGVGLLVGARLQYRMESMPLEYALRMSLVDLWEPGIRIPLGMLVGGLAALAWCLVSGVSWRDEGDALAVAAFVMIPFGRLGCWLNGCCLGSACPSWVPFCMHFPPGSEPYTAQLGIGLIDGSAEHSLPAHPLPIYFGVVSLLILAVIVRMIRQGAAPGLPLAVGIVLGSAGKLALEMLRSTIRPMGVQFILPALALVGTIAVLAVVRLRAPSLFAMPARRARALLVAVGLGVTALAGPAHADPAQDQAVNEALGRYASDPLGSRRALRRLARHGTDGLPPVVLLALGDSQFRAGRWRNAARYFDATIERGPGEPFETWALVGLASSALMAGDIDVASAHLTALEGRGGRNAAVAGLLLGMIDVGDGKDAGDRFTRIAELPDASPQVRDVARLMSGYVLYWRGQYAAAASAFDGIEKRLVSPELHDDARYAAAWARVRAGDRERAERDLRQLAATGSARVGRSSIALINLDQRAVVRDGFQRYRRAQLGAPEDWFARGFDVDGPALARAALRRLNEAARPEAAPVIADVSPLRTSYRMAGAAGDRSPGAKPATAKSVAAPVPAAPAPGPRQAGRLPVFALALAGVVAYLLLARRRTAAPRAVRRS
jgi:phosphatidylglycerol:prolipoprotein diacylglycerol transferase